MSVPCQVSPGVHARSRPRRCGSSNGVGSRDGHRRGPRRRRLPWSPATTAVTRSVVSVSPAWRPPSSAPAPSRSPASGSAISHASSEPRAGALAHHVGRRHRARPDVHVEVGSGRVLQLGDEARGAGRHRRSSSTCVPLPSNGVGVGGVLAGSTARRGPRAPGRSASICRSVMAIGLRGPSSTCEPASRRVVMSIEVGQHAGRRQDRRRAGAPPGPSEPAGGVSTRVPNSHVSVGDVRRRARR